MQFVQEVTSNRDKCFSLAQRMRRAKIPLEKILAQGDRADDELRHAVMDLRCVADMCAKRADVDRRCETARAMSRGLEHVNACICTCYVRGWCNKTD